MNRDEKAAAVAEIADQIKEADAVFAVDYRGISVPQAAALRAQLRDADATFRIVKNSLTERAADEAGATSLRPLLDGPTALTFVRGDAAAAAKALADFARAEELLEFKGGVMDGAEVSVDEIQAIARLPARDVLYGQLVGIVAAPITGLARGLNGLLSGIAIQLGKIVEEGLLPAGEAPPAEEATATEETPAEAPAAEKAPAEEPAAEEAPAEEPAAEEPAAEEPAAEAPAEAAPAEQAAPEAAPAEDTTDHEADAPAAADDDTAAEAKEDA